MTALAEVKPEASPIPSDNPMGMLAAALDRGVDPEKLEKLMDLARTWKAERAAEEFAEAMNQCQRAMPCVIKDAKNSHTNSKYAALETVNVMVKPVYSQHGFSLSFGTDNSPIEGCVRVVCDVRHIGGHKERYFMDAPPDGAGFKGTSNKTGVQAVGSTISYLRRYLILNIFNVTVANEDVDGEAADALDTITEPEALEIEDLITDSGTNRHKFLEWCASGGHLVGGEKAVAKIRAKSFAHVVEILNRKKAGAK